ncbi:MAG: TetR/AcrR family transcriptional regulator, partial [Cellulosimicrobium funkei]
MARAGLSHDAVVRIALDLVDAGGPTGFADLTLAKVAAQAGGATPSLYKHVGSLAALRREV